MALEKSKVGLASQRGMSLVELLVALTVLMIGVTGCVCAIPFTVGNNYRSKQQSNSTVIAQMVMEKIMSVPAGTSPTLTLADCAGNTPNITTVGTATGAGAPLNTSTGDVDYTQSQASAGAGYFMNWSTCGSNGQAGIYDVRWNIVSPDGFVKIITVSARLQRATNGGPNLAPPSTIRSLVGAGS